MVYSSGYLSVVETAGGVVPDRVMKPSPDRRACLECGKHLYRNNQSGYCWKCFEKSPHRLEYQKREYCRRKYGGTPEALTRLCGGGCGAVLRYWNKSGRCRRCVKRLPSIIARNHQQERDRILHMKEHEPEKYAAHCNRIREHAIKQRSTPEGRVRFLLRDANMRAQKSGLPSGIVLSDVLPLPDTCPVFGVKLDYSYGKFTDCSASLDKVIPSLGYVPGNVCIISWRANRIKFNATPEELQALADYATKMARKLSIVS